MVGQLANIRLAGAAAADQTEDGVTMPWVNGRELTADEWNLAYATNGVTLRAACKGEGLAVSGTNAQRGRRLGEAGLSHADVEERYGWRARRSGSRPL